MITVIFGGGSDDAALRAWAGNINPRHRWIHGDDDSRIAVLARAIATSAQYLKPGIPLANDPIIVHFKCPFVGPSGTSAERVVALTALAIYLGLDVEFRIYPPVIVGDKLNIACEHNWPEEWSSYPNFKGYC